MTQTLQWLALAAYLAGTAGFFAYLCNRRFPLARMALAVVALGFCLHVVAYGIECAATRAMVISSAHGSFSFLSLLSVLLVLVIAVRHRLHILGAFVMPPAALGALVAALTPAPGAPAAVLQGPLFPLHVVATFCALSGFLASFGVAVAYLVQEHELKSRRPQTIAYVLPSLSELDRLASRLALASLFLLALGIVSGAVYAGKADRANWLEDPKVYATVLSFLVYAAAFLTRWFLGWRGRKTAYLLIAGFILVLATFLGMSHVLPQQVLGS